MSERIVVGIDVSKAMFDYIWLPGGKAAQAANSAKGIAALVTRLRKLRPEIVVLEATGGYQSALVDALHEAKIPHAVVNPRQVRDYARSLNRLSKTDKLDALTIAQFAQSRKLSPDIPPGPELTTLRFLLRRRDQVQAVITAEKGHLEHTPTALKGEVEEHLSLLKKRLRTLDKQLAATTREVPSLAEKDRVIQSIPGIGPVTSASLMAYLPELSAIGRKQACALAGLAPFNKDSGKYRGPRHIYGGRAQVRKTLYCALRPCLQFNPVIKAWFDRFIARGKAYKVAAIACIRKLLVVIRAMLINGTTWDASLHASA